MNKFIITTFLFLAGCTNAYALTDDEALRLDELTVMWNTANEKSHYWQEQADNIHNEMLEIKYKPKVVESKFDFFHEIIAACDELADKPMRCKKIMKGVFLADSHYGTKGLGTKNNNPGNRLCSKVFYKEKGGKGAGGFCKYSTMKSGIWENVYLYSALYENHSIKALSKRWADGSKSWENIVASAYYE